MAPNSDLANFINIAADLTAFQPSILDWISDDLDAHALDKKEQRAARKRWLEEQTASLNGIDVVPSENPTPRILEIGRSRMEPIVVLTFMLLRGLFGYCCKDSRFRTAVEESMSLRIFLENRGCKLPGASTLEENLNAVSNQTRERIHRVQLALAAEEELDDFKKIRGDSTSVSSASAYPTDSGTIAKLLLRMCSRVENLARIGLEQCPLSEVATWKAELEQLKFRIGTLTSSSAKQAELAAKKEVTGRAQAADDQAHAEKKESAKQRLRRELYEQLYALGEKIAPELENQLVQITTQIQSETCPPKEEGRRIRFTEEFKADLEALDRGIRHSRQRVCEGKKPSAKIGKMPWSVSDMSASFIEKGGWEKIFGYRPQLSFSASNLVTALIVPEGNAADQGQFIPLVKVTIENTGVIPEVVSVDDGYTGAEQLNEALELGIRIVSFSGARGKALLGEKKWESKPYQEARRARNGAESGISVLKARQGFGQLATYELERARGELLEKVIGYNALKIVSLRKRKYEEEHKKKWNAGLPGGRQEVA